MPECAACLFCAEAFLHIFLIFNNLLKIEAILPKSFAETMVVVNFLHIKERERKY